MGAILGFFNSGVDVSDIYIDFAGAKPQAEEKVLCDKVSGLLEEGGKMIKILENYKGCNDIIRNSLNNPTPENEQKAFNGVKKNVEVINNFFKFSKEIEVAWVSVLRSLIGEDEKSSLQEQQALSKKVADILDFVLRFDELKMIQPGLQNDFSFYRRSLGKHNDDPDLVVHDDAASLISLFIAQPIPMMTALSKATTELLNEGAYTGLHVLNVLATIANVCLHLVKSKAFGDPKTNMLCVRAMVGAIVLFDHVSPEGAFVKRSGINIRQAVDLVVKNFADQYALINALRYSTLHYSDESTPSAITALLENA